jgi:hypothetical protein
MLPSYQNLRAVCAPEPGPRFLLRCKKQHERRWIDAWREKPGDLDLSFSRGDTMKYIIAATAALALMTSPALAGHHNSHASKTHSGSSKGNSKGDSKGDKHSKGNDSDNPFSSLLKNFSKLQPHN